MPATRSLPIEAVVTPRFDIFYALYTLSSPGPTPLAAWKEKALIRIPRDFERVAKRVAPIPIFWPLLADAVQRPDGQLGFDDLIDTLRAMPVEELKSNILTGIFHDPATVQALLSRKRTLGQVLADENISAAQLLTHFGLRPFDAQSPAALAITTLLSNAASFRDELALVLQRFWRTGFKSDWNALESVLRADARRIENLRDGNTVAALAGKLALPVAIDERAREIRPRSGSPIKLEQVERVYLVPSAFNTRRWWARYTAGDRRETIYFPILSASISANILADDDWRPEGPVSAESTPQKASSVNAELVFRALGDTTRYAIASILARTPTTSAELARMLKVSKPTITHHVHALRSAGLIVEKAESGSTRLSLDRDTIGAVSSAAVGQLFSSRGELPLVTTRKRGR